MGGVHLVGAEHPAGADYPDGGLAGFHGADLRRRGLGTQQEIIRQVEGVLHVPGGVILGHVQRLEDVVIRFHLRAVHHIEAHGLEDIEHVLKHRVERMKPSRFAGLAGHGHVQFFLFQTLELDGFLDGGLPAGQGLLQLLAQLVDHLPHPGTLLRRKAAHTAQYLGQRAFFAHDADTEFLQVLGRAQGFQFLQGLFPQGVEFLFHCVITCLSLLCGPPG